MALTQMPKSAHTHMLRYRCFNDDIQGTGATAVAGMLSALRQRGQLESALTNEYIVIAGMVICGLHLRLFLPPSTAAAYI